MGIRSSRWQAKAEHTEIGRGELVAIGRDLWNHAHSAAAGLHTVTSTITQSPSPKKQYAHTSSCFHTSRTRTSTVFFSSAPLSNRITQTSTSFLLRKKALEGCLLHFLFSVWVDRKSVV